MDGKATVTVKRIQMVEIDYRCAFDWAKIRFEEETGFVSIQSDYGNWSFGWTSIGPDSLAKFLSGLNVGYMGGKMLGGALNVFDVEGAEEDVLKYIEEETWEDEDEKLWEIGLANDLGRGRGEQSWNDWLSSTDIEEAHLIGWCTKMDDQWRSFWDRIWEPHVKPELKKLTELAA